MKKRLISKILVSICILTMCLSYAYADKTGGNSLDITCKSTDGTKTIVGMSITAYKVGDRDAYGNYTLDKAYSSCKTPTSKTTVSELTALVSEVCKVIESKNIAGNYTAVSNSNGIASFTGMADGIYVLIGETTVYNGYTYTMKPLFIELESWSNSGKSVDISAVAKVSEEAIPTPTSTPTATPTATPSPTETPAPSETPEASPTPEETPSVTPEASPTPEETPSVTPEASPTPEETPSVTPEASPTPEETPSVTPEASPTPESTPTPELDEGTSSGNDQITPTPVEAVTKLPQTGQLWWPVPVLLIAGVILIGVGIRLNKKEQ